tara:strand:+ start:2458 stop:2583 length:126 start_codon:yes stop_codon:yes gene_type:complete
MIFIGEIEPAKAKVKRLMIMKENTNMEIMFLFTNGAKLRFV